MRLKDLASNTLTVTPTGITASNGLSVPFVRDTQGLITKITDPLGNQYLYAYDTNGNLATVQYPGVPRDQYQDFLNAESHGRYFLSNIRDHFRYQRLAKLHVA
jgi:YD repeat-containing protein